MDAADKRILRVIQSNLPIEKRPYKRLGQTMGLSEAEVLDRLTRLKETGVIRRIGGNFNSRRLGFSSTLCAARVPEDRFGEFVRAVNAHPGVTHNYRRDHEYNVWFTFIAESMEAIEAHLKKIAADTGVEDICAFPATKMFKIQVDFPL
ncbi:MAG: AsnC family transcriptional regulator [Desulfarculaceae bacterium]|jgi:DNA-binding Lrp family transcriptional regulator